MINKHPSDVEAEAHGVVRSSEVTEAQYNFLKTAEICACCGRDKKHVTLEAHHKIPFHILFLIGRNELACEPRIFVPLCENTAKTKSNDCHITIGHLQSFQSYNPKVDEDCKKYTGMSDIEIKNDIHWKKEESARPRSFKEWSTDQIEALKEYVNKTYPIHDNA